MVFSGFFKVIASFFALPIIFIKNTFTFLSKVGQEGFQKTTGDDNIPFLNWVFIAGRVLIIFLATAIILASGIIYGSMGYRFDVGDFILGLIMGSLIAFLWIWIAALWLEMLSLGVVLVNNTREILTSMKSKEGQ